MNWLHFHCTPPFHVLLPPQNSVEFVLIYLDIFFEKQHLSVGTPEKKRTNIIINTFQWIELMNFMNEEKWKLHFKMAERQRDYYAAATWSTETMTTVSWECLHAPQNPGILIKIPGKQASMSRERESIACIDEIKCKQITVSIALCF